MKLIVKTILMGAISMAFMLIAGAMISIPLVPFISKIGSPEAIASYSIWISVFAILVCVAYQLKTKYLPLPSFIKK
jgi:uncharacterized membrane protein YraQ (UPF0718 family)